MAALAALLYRAADILAGRASARLATLVLASMLLPLAAAGAVLTDSFFALGVSYSMLAFLVAPTRSTLFWRYGFFVGLAIGLLSKGPLTFVLIGIAIVPWIAVHRQRLLYVTALPWFKGMLVTLALTVPWYVYAEAKTPGFLQYFLVGEHFLRFLDAGWKGDLYGTAHERPLGSIWAEWLLASFPWGWVGVLLAGWLIARPSRRERALQVWRLPLVGYLAMWTLASPVFFTFSGNILWTYVLPGLPAFALLFSIYAKEIFLVGQTPTLKRALIGVGALVPAAAIILGLVSLTAPTRFKTEKQLVAAATAQMTAGQKLYFVHSRPFSARFYSGGKAELIDLVGLNKLVFEQCESAFVAIPKGMEASINGGLRSRLAAIYKSRRYSLYKVEH